MSDTVNVQTILGSEDEPSGILFVLFIPSKDRNGVAFNDQDVWASTAGDMLTTLFGGATIMPPARGKWLNPETNTTITEEVVLVHSYARTGDANDDNKLWVLAAFLHRLGRDTNQGVVAVLIDGVFHRIHNYRSA